MAIAFVDLRSQYFEIKDEVDSAISEVLHRGDFILGQAVHTFEEAFAAYCGAQHCVGVDSGLTAIEIILRGYGIGEGDEVISAANTFHSSVLPVPTVGAKIVLVEADPDTYTLDPAQVEAAITPRTRAIIAVHLYGHPVDMDPLMEIANRHGLKVIEDTAQAHGALYKGRRVGSLGHAAAFSFYPTKNLGCYGDGGAVVTDDAALANKVRMLRNLGQRVRNNHEFRAGNHRLDTIQAAVLNVNLPRLDERNARRQEVAAWFNQALADVPVVRPLVKEWAEPVYHLYVVRVANREVLQAHLAKAGIPTAIHYPVPIHLQPAFADIGYAAGAFPQSEEQAGQILSLPMHPSITYADVEAIAASIREFYQGQEAEHPDLVQAI